MIRFIIIAVLLQVALGYRNVRQVNLSDNPVNNLVQASKCESISQRYKFCLVCYKCDDKTSYNLPLKMFDKTCKEFDFCCKSGADLSSQTRGSEKCGLANGEGKPRTIRPTARSVLPGEYPWRAYIYSDQSPGDPMCAATYFYDYSKGIVLITSASCVKDKDKSSLSLKFTRKHKDMARISNVIIHEEFNAKTNLNDIAIVTASLALIPKWIQRTCRTSTPPLAHTPCLTVSDEETISHVMISNQTHCLDSNNRTIDKSLMCTTGPRAEPLGERGGGLYCLSEDYENERLIIYGISLGKVEKGYALYTNVTNFIDWINRSTQRLR